MPYTRRQFLVSVTGVAAGAPWGSATSPAAQADANPKNSAAKRSPARPLDVALFMDVEDIFSPPEVGNDDSIKELATILTQEELRANFLFIGDRALLLKERGRQDVIASLAPHDVGLHTRSARHPTSPEYIAGKTWEEGVALALKHEREGAEILRQVFGKPCAALSSHNVFDTPHSQRAAAVLGLPYVYCYPAAPPLYSISWYAGALGLPYSSPTLKNAPFRPYFEGFDDNYPDDAKFNAQLGRLDEHINICLDEGQPYLTLFIYHPQLVRLAEFIDTFWWPNGVNYPNERWGMYGRPRGRTPEQVKTALGNFRKLARWLRADKRLNVMTITEVARKYGSEPASIARGELVEAAQAITKGEEILVGPRFSPAEMVVGMARALVDFAEQGKLPDSVQRENVLGPTRNPLWHPEMQRATFAKLIDLARQLLEHVAATGHLPATFGPPLERVGINHLYRAFAESLLATNSGSALPEVKFRRMMPWPALGPAIGTSYLKAVEGEMMNPDTEVNTLYRDGKLQTWTLKPAILP